MTWDRYGLFGIRGRRPTRLFDLVCGIVIIAFVCFIIAISQNERLFDEEVAYYTDLADSEDWCYLVKQPENHTWDFHKEHYALVISKWDRATRKGLRKRVEEQSGITTIRIVESDLVLFFFHAIPDTRDSAGVTYWKSGA